MICVRDTFIQLSHREWKRRICFNGCETKKALIIKNNNECSKKKRKPFIYFVYGMTGVAVRSCNENKQAAVKQFAILAIPEGTLSKYCILVPYFINVNYAKDEDQYFTGKYGNDGNGNCIE